MKRLLIIFIAIILAAPLSSFLINMIWCLMDLWESHRTVYNEYWSFWDSVTVYAICEIPIYVVIGIPSTLIIDFVIKTDSTIGKRFYLLQFFLYSLFALFLGLFFPAIFLGLISYVVGIYQLGNFFIMVVIAVHIYFHILFYLRIIFYKENKDAS